MTAPIDFFVAGVAVPQPRPRGRIAGPRHKPFVQIYNPSDADEWKRAIASRARVAYPIQPLDEALRLCLSFRMPRPQSHFNRSGLKAHAPHFHTGRPDGDNLQKSVMDALNEILWRDDARICQWYGEKVYAAPGTEPGCRVLVTSPVDNFIDPELFAGRELEAGRK